MTAGAPASLQARLLTRLLRLTARPVLARETAPHTARRRFVTTARLFLPDPPFAVFLPDRLEGGLPALWAGVAGRGGAGVLLFLHGGAYVVGSPRTHRALAARLAAAAGLTALLPHYRRAPEHPFPTAVEDALAAYRTLLARGYPPGRIVLAGDSAGGGLALALLAILAAEGLPAPAGLVAFSPQTDLTLSGPSWQENAARDAILPAERGAEIRDMYLQGADPTDPRASPLFADWPVPPPPVLLFAAETEILRDDAVRMAARLRAAGGQAALRLAGDLPHVWPMQHRWLPEARATLAEAGAWVARVLHGETGAAPPSPGKG